MTDRTAPGLAPCAVIATMLVLVAYTLPGTATLLVLAIAAAAFAVVRTVGPLFGATSRPDTVAAWATAAALVVLGGPVVAAATLGPRSVPLLACVVVALTLAGPLVPALRGSGQEPRNVDR